MKTDLLYDSDSSPSFRERMERLRRRKNRFSSRFHTNEDYAELSVKFEDINDLSLQDLKLGTSLCIAFSNLDDDRESARIIIGDPLQFLPPWLQEAGRYAAYLTRIKSLDENKLQMLLLSVIWMLDAHGIQAVLNAPPPSLEAMGRALREGGPFSVRFSDDTYPVPEELLHPHEKPFEQARFLWSDEANSPAVEITRRVADRHSLSELLSKLQAEAKLKKEPTLDLFNS